MDEPLIQLRDVSKTFVVTTKAGRLRRRRRLVEAVAGVTFDVAAGEMVGYIGPNGAGKSTTIKMLTGILVPTSGHVRVAGLDPSRSRVALARRIGVVFGQRTQLWWDLPLRDSFALLRHVYRVDAARHVANLDRFVEVLDLGSFLETPVRQLSLGQRMRGELTAALLHDPEILYLDEPTIGLDVVSKLQVRDFLATVNGERGTTVVLTTHDLDDIERLCRRVLVIDHGTVLFDGALDDIKARLGGERTLVVDLDEPAPPIDVEGVSAVRVDGPRQWLTFRRADATAAQVVSRVMEAHRVRDLAIEDPDIEEVIRRLYAGPHPTAEVDEEP